MGKSKCCDLFASASLNMGQTGHPQLLRSYICIYLTQKVEVRRGNNGNPLYRVNRSSDRKKTFLLRSVCDQQQKHTQTAKELTNFYSGCVGRQPNVNLRKRKPHTAFVRQISIWLFCWTSRESSPSDCLLMPHNPPL